LALFVVPSEKFPGKSHVWKVHWFFVKGQKEIRFQFKKNFESAVDSIFVGIPDQFFGSSFLAVNRGISNMYNGILELIDLAVGIPAFQNIYTDEEAGFFKLFAAKSSGSFKECGN
jgi:hypothetical protein